MTPLETFLNAADLDDALHARDDIGPLTAQELERISGILSAWKDRQAVANLLIHTDLIPSHLRFEALDRALQATDVPYYRLAATVGLQNIALSEVPDEKRGPFVEALLNFLQSTWPPLADRASVTLFGWARSDRSGDLLRRMLALYPAPNEGVTRNLAAAVLARYGALAAQEFAQQLIDLNTSDIGRRELEKVYRDYQEMKARNEFRARLMEAPGFAYIPNLSEGLDQRPPLWRRLLTRPRR